MNDALDAVVLDCPDPAALAGFYRCLLGGEPEDVGQDRVDLVGAGVTIGFHRVDESPRTAGGAGDGAPGDGGARDGGASGAGAGEGAADRLVADGAADRLVADGAAAGRGSAEPHLDIDVADLEAAHRRVLALGAVLLDGSHAPDWQAYADPAGHLFCLVSS